MIETQEIRRTNARYLSDSVGGVTAFAEKLEKSQSQMSQVIGQKPIKNIGARLARQIESTFCKPNGWLDNVHFDKSGIASPTLSQTVITGLTPSTVEFARIYQQLSPDKQKLLSDTAKAFLLSKD